MTLRSDTSRKILRRLNLHTCVREKRRRGIRRGGGETGTSGSCVVPSDWEGQAAGEAAAVALMDLPFIDHSKINTPQTGQEHFLSSLRTMLTLSCLAEKQNVVQHWCGVVNNTVCNWMHLFKVKLTEAPCGRYTESFCKLQTCVYWSHHICLHHALKYFLHSLCV